MIDSGNFRGTCDGETFGYTFIPDLQRFERNEVLKCAYVIGMDDPNSLAASLPDEVIQAVMDHYSEERQLDSDEKTESHVNTRTM